MDGRHHRDAERRARAGFRRRTWERHRGLVVLWLLCAAGLSGIGLVSLLRYDGDRPDWLTLLHLALLVGGGALFVVLVRRDDPDADD